MTRAVVFAYHDVGVRCLTALLEIGVEVALVVTHEDNPHETIWFASVAQLARSRGIAVITPSDPNDALVVAKIAAIKPDFIFSFYYRNLLGAALLAIPPRGAFNLHGSLLPKYRGRVPINWAIIHGETETGATLHQMNVKPDNGPIVDQEAVPIGPDDTAQEVFIQVTAAAAQVVRRAVPKLIDGSAVLRLQDLSQGAYFGGRKPADGRIDWAWSAQRLHNFVRALTQPYPGAFADFSDTHLVVWRTQIWSSYAMPEEGRPWLILEHDAILFVAKDGSCLTLLSVEVNQAPLTPSNFRTTFGSARVALS